MFVNMYPNSVRAEIARASHFLLVTEAAVTKRRQTEAETGHQPMPIQN